MNVLSLFDGMSCGQIALNRIGIKPDKYFASEIDNHAIDVTQYNYPNTIQLGDIRNLKGSDLPKVDLLMGGSPCQGFSVCGGRLNFQDPRSKLFFEYLRILQETKPRFWLLENVPMKKEWQDIISDYMAVEPIKLNSSLVSAQNRSRLYWTNIPFAKNLPDKKLVLKDIIQHEVQDFLTDYVVPLEKHKSHNGLICVGGLSKINKWLDNGKNLQRNFSQGERIYSIEGKSPTLSACSGGTAGPGNFLITYDIHSMKYRKLTPVEAERLQTVPDNYTSVATRSQRHKMLGNGWTIDIIAHILKGM